MADKRYFCMIHEGRCGSTVLASLLDQHPAIVHFNEILTKGAWISREFVNSELEARRDASEIRLPDLNKFIKQVAETRRSIVKPDQLYVGFEIKLNQLSSMNLDCDLPSLVREVSSGSPDARFMFLTRRNILRRHVSILRCQYKNVTHADQLKGVNFDKVRLDVDDKLRDWSYEFTRFQASLADLLEISETRRLAVRDFALANGHLYLEYEDFEHRPMTAAEQTFDFLDVPRIEVESPLLKTGDFPLSDLIENYDEVRESLVNTRWMTMLD
ncbi:MAG: sulfotransferase [Akkermansiaceae bacterium]